MELQVFKRFQSNCLCDAETHLHQQLSFSAKQVVLVTYEREKICLHCSLVESTLLSIVMSCCLLLLDKEETKGSKGQEQCFTCTHSNRSLLISLEADGVLHHFFADSAQIRDPGVAAAT